MIGLTLPSQVLSAKLIFLDFEFRKSNERLQELVCASLYNARTKTQKNYWLFNSSHEELRSHIQTFHDQGYIFCAYNVVAEARCFISLGLDPVEFEWIDLMLEHRQLVNSNEKLSHGWQLIAGKEVKTVNESKWDKTEEELARMNRSKAVTSLASAAYKFLKEKIDTQHKSDTIQLILGAEGFNQQQKLQIIQYCSEDTKILPPIFRQMLLEYSRWWARMPASLKPKGHRLNLTRAMHLRGRYAALTAVMVSRGYPVKKKWFENFLLNVPTIYTDVRKDIAAQFEEYQPFVRKFKKKNDEMKFSVKNVRAWVEEKSGHAKGWLRTDKKALSLKSEAWDKFYNFKHDYPEGNYPAQIMRWNSFKKSMAGFAEADFKDSKILEYYSTYDSRIRPYMNPYGSQTARSQPKSISFIPLKTAWSRSLIYQEDPSKFLCSIDYGSQEVLIQAILSSDKSLYESYISGDVYLDFAKKAGAVPKDGTKKTHAHQRTIYKTAFLAIGYGVGYRTLANQIASNTESKPDEDKAKELIEQFYQVYHKYYEFLMMTKQRYGFDQGIYEKPSGNGFLQLACGWILMGDNLSHRSVGNFLVQGNGSSIMREAVWQCHKAKLPVVYTLHDALTCELEDQGQIDHFKKIMSDAFIDIMAEVSPLKDWAKKIRLDVNCWGEYFKTKTLNNPDIKEQIIYIDERAQSSFDFYKKYFEGVL